MGGKIRSGLGHVEFDCSWDILIGIFSRQSDFSGKLYVRNTIGELIML